MFVVKLDIQFNCGRSESHLIMAINDPKLDMDNTLTRIGEHVAEGKTRIEINARQFWLPSYDVTCLTEFSVYAEWVPVL